MREAPETFPYLVILHLVESNTRNRHNTHNTSKSTFRSIWYHFHPTSNCRPYKDIPPPAPRHYSPIYGVGASATAAQAAQQTP